MTNFTKNVLKYLLITLLLVILVYLGYIFLINKKNIKKINNNATSSQNQDQNQKIKINIEPKQSSTSAPVLLNSEEKKKYGIDTDKPVYLEMIEGNKDFPGRLPRLIIPPEVFAEMVASSSKNIGTKTDKK